jgi:hypothetical protein
VKKGRIVSNRIEGLMISKKKFFNFYSCDNFNEAKPNDSHFCNKINNTFQ